MPNETHIPTPQLYPSRSWSWNKAPKCPDPWQCLPVPLTSFSWKPAMSWNVEKAMSPNAAEMQETLLTLTPSEYHNENRWVPWNMQFLSISKFSKCASLLSFRCKHINANVHETIISSSESIWENFTKFQILETRNIHYSLVGNGDLEPRFFSDAPPSKFPSRMPEPQGKQKCLETFGMGGLRKFQFR